METHGKSRNTLRATETVLPCLASEPVCKPCGSTAPQNRRPVVRSKGNFKPNSRFGISVAHTQHPGSLRLSRSQENSSSRSNSPYLLPL